MASLRIDGLWKRFGSLDILKGIALEVGDGEFLVLVGPSGCGKSTLLNLVAGLDSMSAGEIRIGDRVVNAVHPKDRNIAMVFQSYALYPNMTVRRNITFGMEIRKVPRDERERALQRVAKLLQIEPLLERKPSQLSGGQRQRVAMGRALVRDPQIFLFDEPLSNLDAKLRVEMRTEIKRLHHRLGTTIVYVTHDQIEAMTLATRIAVMRDGEVQQYADPQTIYERPANLFVAGFMGSPPMNFIPGRLIRDGGGLGVRLGDGAGPPSTFPVPGDYAEWIDREVVLGLRPEAITRYDAREAEGKSGHHGFECAVDVVEPTGADTMVFMTLGGTETIARVRPHDAAPPGATMRFMADMTVACLFDPASGRRIGARA